MKKKLIKIMLFLAFLAPVTCQALTFTDDGVIDGGTYTDVYILNTATVGMTAGTVDTMYIENLGTMNYFDGTITDIELRNSATFNLEGSSLSGSTLSSRGSGNFNLNSGAYQGTLDMWEYSHNVLNDGQLTATLASFYDYVITDVYGGNIAWDSISLHGYSELNIYGGDVSFNNGFNLHEDAGINVYYSDIIEWDEIITGYHLLDGSEFMLDQFTQYEIDQINFVPEPTTFLLLGLGGLLLRKRK
ncbi:MAG: PEP-CTERM sorting domain-containing protein [Planctomycetota bacterium]|jgi:hypothetical protein